ncbi:MAG TPA: deoxyribodipyrimidine photo-lyase [Methanoregulaceae archaeon]|nr:deoxyribodipyrimidine photo-lyase [Methanoregulaceae archaeon]HQN89272.1 deoxyribodipyrimidine photo-lyase [Methanoregulaceae archaeon]
MIPEERVAYLSKKSVKKGHYILYWMQAAPRITCNHAYQYAVRMAERHSLPLLACFDLIPGYPGATCPHYRFMVEGLIALSRDLEAQGVRFLVRTGPPGTSAWELGGDAALVVTDRGYLRFQDQWQQQVAGELDCPLVRVETNVVVPAGIASEKEEWSAATFRRKITPHIDRFLLPLEERKPSRSSIGLGQDFEREMTVESLLSGIPGIVPEQDGTLQPYPLPWKGGEEAAAALLKRFIARHLDHYPLERNDPSAGAISCMSPYLHFGQISPVFIAQNILRSGSLSAAAYLEELIVRRELAINFVHYNPLYDAYAGLPAWAKKTLSVHSADRREYSYGLSTFESARTHDPYWNAAQREMVITGKMHGYMRMYWGKKILEWSDTPEEAYQIALILNNRYELDGRDPNGYAGVAWCFGKHDRPWKERPVFGTIRYMNAAGLNRKFDAGQYAATVSGLRDERNT